MEIKFKTAVTIWLLFYLEAKLLQTTNPQYTKKTEGKQEKFGWFMVLYKNNTYFGAFGIKETNLRYMYKLPIIYCR